MMDNAASMTWAGSHSPLGHTCVPAEAATLYPDFAASTPMERRYEDAAATFELLYVKPGSNSLASDGKLLATGAARPHPGLATPSGTRPLQGKQSS